MDEARQTPPAVAPEGADDDSGITPTWRRAPWQAPTLALGVLMLLSGTVAAFLGRPSPELDAMLAAAAARLDADDHRAALAVLNEDLLPFAGHPDFTPERLARFHVLRARAILLGRRAMGAGDRANDIAAVEEFRRAERLGLRLEPRDVSALADALIALGQSERALEAARSLPAAERARASAIVRAVIDARLDRLRGSPAEETLLVLGELLASPTLDPGERAWALARQAEVLIRAGSAEEALTRLLRALPRVVAEAPAHRLDLLLILGRAYLETGDIASARSQLAAVLELSDESQPVHADATILLARIDETLGELESARDRFASVVKHAQTDPAFLPALLGLAEMHAALDEDDLALERYQELIGELTYGKRHRDVTREVVAASLGARAEERLSAEAPQAALRFATLAQDLFSPAPAPVEIVRVLAAAHRAIAEEIAAPFERTGGVQAMDAATREQVRRHFLAAGTFYRLLADASHADDRAFADALWLTADSFERAGEIDQALPAFQSYLSDISDPSRQGEARYRLARAYLARGEHELAIDLFRGLVSDHRDPDRRSGVGPWGQASIVPLARTLLLDVDDGNDAEAETLLRRFIDTSPGSGGDALAEALHELGRLYYRAGRYPDAIARLTELERRFPEYPLRVEAVFELADACRLEAERIQRTLRDAMPDHERRDLAQARTDRLRRATDLYADVCADIALRPERTLSPVQRTYLRNAWFYQGSCAFDLGDFDAAIQLYDAARERYPRDPASLVALMQIVSAYLARGDLARAVTANERARAFYAGIPEEVWSDPTLPIARADWERWLAASASLAGRTAAAGDR
jgi:tetratricopeptide (TPR) repeat protein